MKMSMMIAVVILFFSSMIHADPWSTITKITNLYPYNSGLAFMTGYKNESLSSCDGGTRFSISKIHPNYEVMISSMMAAFMADKAIKFNIHSGQSKNCHPTIDRFVIYK
jgi:hypothetical protein